MSSLYIKPSSGYCIPTAFKACHLVASEPGGTQGTCTPQLFKWGGQTIILYPPVQLMCFIVIMASLWSQSFDPTVIDGRRDDTLPIHTHL
jgi:hypothetical protein